MLAYVFWHRPRPGVAPVEYAAALQDFHTALAAANPPGFGGSWTVRAGDLPWLGPQPVYEDRYLIGDFADLGPLNDAAVAAGRRAAHDAAAARAGFGTAGLYRLIHGPARTAAGTAWWFDKPTGMPYDRFRPGPGSLWQRQLTLGPGPEYQLVGPEPDVAGRHGTGIEPV